jgi:hypothetical protein
MIARRTFLKSASVAAVSMGVSEAQQVPNSSGNEPAKLSARWCLRLPLSHL